MATNGQHSSHSREALHKALPRLYKFALVLTANEELARALLRGTCKALLNARTERQEDDPSRLTGSFRRMYALWAARMAEDQAIHRKYPAEPHLFTGAFKGPLAGSANFARFIAELPAQQRAVLYLVYGEGASYDEAAEVAELNMLSLMKLLARGHRALTHWLDQRGFQEDGRAGFDPHSLRERAA
jgi:RNA polymerase sigma-70 factor (ECF subfamily)